MAYKYTYIPCRHTLYDHARVSPSASPDQSCLVVQGQGGDFRPAGLPAPLFFISVNPNGPSCDPTDDDFDFNLAYEPGLDAQFAVLSSLDVEQAKQKLALLATEDMPDHLTCDNAGLYAIWQLAAGRFVLGGFDTGGSDIAQTGTLLVARELGSVVQELGASHFDPERELDPDYQSNGEEYRQLGELTQLLLDVDPNMTPVGSNRPSPSA